MHVRIHVCFACMHTCVCDCVCDSTGQRITAATTPVTGMPGTVENSTFSHIPRSQFGDNRLFMSSKPSRRGCSGAGAPELPAAIEQAHAQLSCLRVYDAATACEHYRRTAAAALPRSVIRKYWCSVAQRSRRMLAASNIRRHHQASVNHILGGRKPSETILFYGNAFSARNAAGGNLASNVPAFLENAGRHIRAVGVDEYGSTKFCAVCHKGIMHIGSNRKGSCSNCSAYIDRDANG